MISVAQLGVKIGKRIVNKYLSVKKAGDKTSYRQLIKAYLSNNTHLAELIEKDDSFFSLLGTKVMDILKFSELIDVRVVSVSRDEKRLEYVIADKRVLNINKRDLV